MIDDIVKGVLRFLFDLFFEIILFYTGEFILYFITFGRKKPRWDYYLDSSPTIFVIFTEISVWVGLLFWILVAFLIARIYLNI